jgi:outer membrane protein
MKILKSFLILISWVVITTTVFGQTEKGKIMIGGGSSFNLGSDHSKYTADYGHGDGGSSFNLGISPEFSFFVINHLSVGLQLPISIGSAKNNQYKSTSSAISFSPFIRYYFGKTNIRPYLNVGTGIGSVSYHYDPGPAGVADHNTDNIYSFNFGGGAGIFLNEKIMMDIGLGYNSTTMKARENNSSNYRTISNGIGITMGFKIVL